MKKRIEGLRLLADALEVSRLQGVSFPEQAIGMGLHFRTQYHCDVAEAALVDAGGVVDRLTPDKADPLLMVSFAPDPQRGRGWGGVTVSLSVHDDGEGSE